MNLTRGQMKSSNNHDNNNNIIKYEAIHYKCMHTRPQNGQTDIL